MNPTNDDIADAALEFYRSKQPAADEDARRIRCGVAKSRLYRLLQDRLDWESAMRRLVREGAE